MKILGLISSPFDPASRVRIQQYEVPFQSSGHQLRCKYYRPLRDANPAGWAKNLQKISGINAWRSSDLIKSIGRMPLLIQQSGYDIIWQNRLIQLQHLFWEKQLRKPVVFDFDDAIWLQEGEKQVQQKITRSQLIFAGNSYLADYAARFHKDVRIVPTTVDTAMLQPSSKKADHFNIGWIGTYQNQQYLDAIKDVLIQFLQQNKDARLIVVADHPMGNLPYDEKQIQFRQWSAANENELINEFSVGIMPLPDTAWTRGKCSYKMLQYMACGKPVLVSPVGKNREILQEADLGFGPSTETDWMKSLQLLKQDPALCNQLGLAGRKLAEEKYSVNRWTPLLLQYMEELI